MSLSRTCHVLVIGWLTGLGFATRCQAAEPNGSAPLATHGSPNASPTPSGDAIGLPDSTRARGSRFPRRDLAGRRKWHLQLSATALLESWDKNLSSEQLYGGTIGVGYQWHPEWSIILETSLLRVVQDHDDARLLAFATTARWRFTTWNGIGFYTELGVGFSHADVAVPRGGTRFNYLLQAGLVATCPLGSRNSLIGGPRWTHISNNGREGRSRNPDLQALGGYVGLLFPF